MLGIDSGKRSMHKEYEKRYVCWVCGASFTEPGRFLFHINQHKR